MKKWPIIPITEFLKPCSKRIKQDEKHICETISNEIGHPIKIDPVMCAQCMVFEQPNEQFLKIQINRNYMEILSYVPFGFYTAERAEDIIRKAYILMEEDNKKLVHLGRIIISCVETGVLSLATAEVIAKDMPKLEKIQ